MANPLRIGIRWHSLVLAAFIGIASTWLYAPNAASAPYPERTVTIVAAFPAGGIVDIIARRIAQRFSERFSQTFIVENKTGAAGSIGYAAAARAKPDGYTLVLASGPTTMAPPGEASMGWDPLVSFSAIGMIGTIPQAIVASNAVPARNLREFVEFAKSKAGQLNYGSAGPGTTPFFTMEVFKNLKNIGMTHIAYRGQPEMIIALIQGDLAIASITATLVTAIVQSGKMKALGVTSKTRLSSLPDVATVHEQGIPELGISNWFALLAPANLAPEVITSLARALNDALAIAEMKSSLAEIGLATQTMSPADTLAFVKSDLARWIAMSKTLETGRTANAGATN